MAEAEAGLMDFASFLEDARAFVELSEKVGDNWELHEKDTNDGNTYLVATRKFYLKCTPEPEDELFAEEEIPNDDCQVIRDDGELFHVEYHVVYSISYQVPVLYFKGYRRDCKIMGLEDAWKIFESSSKNFEATTQGDMLKTLTQMDHPVLFKPYLALHPCKTHEVLSNTPDSKNRILTFLSIFGPYVGLHLSNSYGIYVDK